MQRDSTALLIDRRTLLTGAMAMLACGVAVAAPGAEFDARMTAIQARIGGRLGVCVIDTGSPRRWQFHADERFAMCSTFKLLLAACVLAQADAGKLDLARRLTYSKEELLPTSPVTTQHLAEGLSIRDLGKASVEVSDNAAANLLLNLVAGPAGLTAFLRSQGDNVTRLDRTETQLNTNLPGDLRDTTTAAAMATTVAKLLTGDALGTGSRDQLIAWLKNSSTGVRRMRAGLPPDWIAGDKTGTGARGSVNDVMIAFPPGRKPLVAAVYLSDSNEPTLVLEQAHKEVGEWIGGLVL